MGERIKNMNEKSCAVCRVKGAALEVCINGEIDHHTARAVREKIDAAVYAQKPRVLRLYLNHMRFMDSAGLGLIIGRVACAAEIGAEVELYGADARALKIFEMAGLSRMKGLCIMDEKGKR